MLKSTRFILLFSLVAYSSANAFVHTDTEIYIKPKPWGPIIYNSSEPNDCPVERSKEFVAVEFTGRNMNYGNADTCYPSWASNDVLYTPFTDGRGRAAWSLARSYGKRPNSGFAKIEGDDPLNFKVTPLGVYPNKTEPYGGRYPSASLVYNGVWYYGTYSLDYLKGYNWGILGPFVGFRFSTDYGKTWQDTTHTPSDPLFKESAMHGNVVKIGAPHFVDFGKNMQYSPDGKAYLVAHGSLKDDPMPRPANNSWISGDQIYLIRVTPSIENINDMSKYEFFAGYDDLKKPRWSKNFEDIKPIFEWNNNCGCVTITYNHNLKKFIMCVTSGWPTIKFMDSYFLESDNICGPWKLITYMKHFGEQGYFLNIPTKFISPNGRKMWLSYSGNFAKFPDLKVYPKGGGYCFVFQEMRFLTKEELESYPSAKNEEELKRRIEEWKKNSPLLQPINLARTAKVTAFSDISNESVTAKGYPAENAIDGDIDTDWLLNSYGKAHCTSTWIRLKWNKKQKINKILLVDQKDEQYNILDGTVKMSNGASFTFNKLPNEENRGLEISFEEQDVDWIDFSFTSEKKQVGIAEIAVF